MVDAEAVAGFEAGDAFDPEVAGRLRELVHAAGNLGEPAEVYLASRGRLPSPDPLPHQLSPSAGEACGPLPSPPSRSGAPFRCRCLIRELAYQQGRYANSGTLVRAGLDPNETRRPGREWRRRTHGEHPHRCAPASPPRGG